MLPILAFGLTKEDVDGFASHGTGTLPPIDVAEYLGLKPTWIDSTGVGGGTRHRPLVARGFLHLQSAHPPELGEDFNSIGHRAFHLSFQRADHYPGYDGYICGRNRRCPWWT